MPNNTLSAEPLLKLDEVAVGYEGQPVLSGVSFRLQRGSFTGLLGANGSGKSTLLKTMLGILPVIAGRMEIGRIGGREPVLGYVPQRETLDENFPFSAFEVALMGTYRRVPAGRPVARGDHEFTRECLRQTGADGFADKLFSRLSGGQKQRVLIARALATQPDFLLLDEPTAGIDTASSQAVMELLTRLHAEQALTILMVNHDLQTVRRHVHDVIWLHRGNVLYGPVAGLLSREKVNEILELEVL